MQQDPGLWRIGLATSAAGVAVNADFIVSAVTASDTVKVAYACTPGICKDTFFLDFKSASSCAKKRAAAQIDDAGRPYVEGAVMCSIPPYRIKAPLMLGGALAGKLSPLINVPGLSSQAVSDKPGVASATKRCRRVMINSLEAMVVKNFTAARRCQSEYLHAVAPGG